MILWITTTMKIILSPGGAFSPLAGPKSNWRCLDIRLRGVLHTVSPSSDFLQQLNWLNPSIRRRGNLAMSCGLLARLGKHAEHATGVYSRPPTSTPPAANVAFPLATF